MIETTHIATIDKFIDENAQPNATVYSDENGIYSSLPNHTSVSHGTGQYVDGDTHTNGIESLWSPLKPAHTGTYHRMSPKHLQRYVNEFVGRHNDRDADTFDQMRLIAEWMNGKRLSYNKLYAERCT